jgi:hypothetical protein
MDIAARKLGMLEFDRHRGRPVDLLARQRLLAEMKSLEEQIAEAEQVIPLEQRRDMEDDPTS